MLCGQGSLVASGHQVGPGGDDAEGGRGPGGSQAWYQGCSFVLRAGPLQSSPLPRGAVTLRSWVRAPQEGRSCVSSHGKKIQLDVASWLPSLPFSFLPPGSQPRCEGHAARRATQGRWREAPGSRAGRRESPAPAPLSLPRPVKNIVPSGASEGLRRPGTQLWISAQAVPGS